MRQIDTHQIEKDAKSRWDRDAKLRGEFGDNFTAYLAFRKADAAGKIKVLGPRTDVEVRVKGASHV